MRLRFVKLLLPLLGLGYLLSPIDALPDLAGPIGFIDDLLLLALIYYYRFRVIRQQTENAQRARPQNEPEEDESEVSPHEVLGVPPDATAEEIRSAYLSLAAQYHPDKVSHLGPELQQVAHRKMVQIQQAYGALTKAAQRR